MRKCLTVGLTGQSGAGKTVVSEIFKEHGFGIINCDMVAREVTTSGSDCNRELSEHFPACFDDKLTLDRRAATESSQNTFLLALTISLRLTDVRWALLFLLTEKNSIYLTASYLNI